jgi:hypothetical protein
VRAACLLIVRPAHESADGFMRMGAVPAALDDATASRSWVVYPRICSTDLDEFIRKAIIPVPCTAHHDIPATGDALLSILGFQA